jgi:hypothetical protein
VFLKDFFNVWQFEKIFDAIFTILAVIFIVVFIENVAIALVLLSSVKIAIARDAAFFRSCSF